jgi:hypothetical protein
LTSSRRTLWAAHHSANKTQVRGVADPDASDAAGQESSDRHPIHDLVGIVVADEYSDR